MNKLLTVAEVAERLGKSEQSLRWMMRVGTAPKFAKIGNRWMAKADQVEAWIDAQFEQAS
jgi:predicted DNA-binding transcriptional regulator AlpA